MRDAPGYWRGDVERFGLSVPLLFSGAGDWSCSVTPSVEISRVKGADSSESTV